MGWKLAGASALLIVGLEEAVASEYHGQNADGHHGTPQDRSTLVTGLGDIVVAVGDSETVLSGTLDNSVVTLDRTVAAALKFMEKNPDTLLIITSDHETGGVQLEGDNTKYLSDLLTVTEHTATPVRVFGVGKRTEYFKGKAVDNTDSAKFLISAIKGQ